MNRNRRINRKFLSKPIDPEDASKERIENTIFDKEEIVSSEYSESPLNDNVNDERVIRVQEHKPSQVITTSGNLRKRSSPFLALKKLKSLPPLRGDLPLLVNSLPDYNYTSTLSEVASLGTEIPSLTTRLATGDQINVKIGNYVFTKFDDVVVSDKVYLDTTLYGRTNGATLLPLDVLNVYSDKVDIGIYCAEVYKNKDDTGITKVDGAEIKVGSKVFGGDYSFKKTEDVNPTDIDDNVTVDANGKEVVINEEDEPIMSTAQDTCGNCYVIRKNVLRSDVAHCLVQPTATTYKCIAPSNMSQFNGYNASNPANWKMVITPPKESYVKKDSYLKEHSLTYERIIPASNETDLCAFDCYVTGFLFLNASSKPDGGEIDQNKPHCSLIWLENPTLIKITKVSDNYSITIGDIIETTTTFTKNSDGDVTGGEIELTTGTNSEKILPVSSDFVKNNFSSNGTVNKIGNCTIKIMSLAKYWDN